MKIKIKYIVFVFLFNTLAISATDLPKINKGKLFKNKIFNKTKKKHPKAVAAAFDITLGLFGVHRLYLGTKPSVPMLYAITLGGGGFLLLTDLGLIIFTKDFEKLVNNEHVFLWNFK